VYRAHQASQFIEDAARLLLTACYGLVKRGLRCRQIEVYSRSVESIHGFDITARAGATKQELCDLLGETSG
jgi:GTP cyclohydrolase FolE2